MENDVLHLRPSSDLSHSLLFRCHLLYTYTYDILLNFAAHHVYDFLASVSTGSIDGIDQD
jgi:hypothetical protein